MFLRRAALLIACLALAVGCEQINGANNLISGQDYRIVVGGTPGTTFTALQTTGVMAGDWTLKSVEGTVPAEYDVHGNLAGLSLQKDDDSGTIDLQIYQGTQLLKEATSSTPNDVVEVSVSIIPDLTPVAINACGDGEGVTPC